MSGEAAKDVNKCLSFKFVVVLCIVAFLEIEVMSMHQYNDSHLLSRRPHVHDEFT